MALNELRKDPAPKNQEKIGRGRDGRGRFRPNVIEEEVKGQPEEIKTEQTDELEEEIKESLTNEDTPLLEDTRIGAGSQPSQVRPDDIPNHIENALGNDSRRDIVTNNKFVSMVGAFIMG